MVLFILEFLNVLVVSYDIYIFFYGLKLEFCGIVIEGVGERMVYYFKIYGYFIN